MRCPTVLEVAFVRRTPLERLWRSLVARLPSRPRRVEAPAAVVEMPIPRLVTVWDLIAWLRAQEPPLLFPDVEGWPLLAAMVASALGLAALAVLAAVVVMR